MNEGLPAFRGPRTPGNFTARPCGLASSQPVGLEAAQRGVLDGIGQRRRRNPRGATRLETVRGIDHGILIPAMTFLARQPASHSLFDIAERLPVEARDIEPSVPIESHHVISNLVNRGGEVIQELDENVRRPHPLPGKLWKRMGRGLGEHRLELAGRQAMQTISLIDEKHSRCQSHAEDAIRFARPGG